jgi:outer membrane protein W
MRKLIVLLLVALGTSIVTNAQDGFGPSAGDISVSLQLGKAESFSNLQYVAKPSTSSDYSLYTPYATTVSTSDNSMMNMIGVEGKYFVTDQIAVRLSGMGIIDVTPAQTSVPGVTYYNTQLQNAGVSSIVLPAYNAIESKTTHRFTANVGGDYYFAVDSRRVCPYGGAMLSFNYGRHQYFTLDDDDLGARFSETYGLGGSVVGGIDYYVAEGMFLGFEVKAFNYIYSVNKLAPVAGVEAYDANTHTISFLSNPVFKIGFKF